MFWSLVVKVHWSRCTCNPVIRKHIRAFERFSSSLPVNMDGSNKTDIYATYIERLHEAAATGDTEMLKSALKVLPDSNAKNDKGWTALMFAARNGHPAASQVLINQGCDKDAINSSGQTAADIARFWNHQDVLEAILNYSSNDATGINSHFGQLSLRAQGFPQTTNFFCGNPLDKMAHKRKDGAWLETMMADKNTKYLLMSDLNPSIVAKPDHALNTKSRDFKLFTAKYADITELLERKPVVVFLGVEDAMGIGEKQVPAEDGQLENDKTQQQAWFAIDASTMSEERLKQIHAHAEYAGHYQALMGLPKKEAAIFSQARITLAWHDRYQFCPTCGCKTTVLEAGYKRKCVKDDCRSQKGVHNTSYPRLDPTVIMAVVSPDGKSLLLGRGKRFPRGMFSCLAGFMEPGESLEETCQREVEEESGIKVTRVEYHSCQPWPMPCSLMLGCMAYATTTDIQVDPEELEDAKWFTRQETVQLLNHSHPEGYFCPPEQAIAHQLIRTWVNMASNL